MGGEWETDDHFTGSEPALDVDEQVLAAQVAERQRLASELHDSVGGILAGIFLELSTLGRVSQEPAVQSRLGDLARATQQALSEIRTLSFALQTPWPEKDTLLDASVEDFARGFGRRAGLKITVRVNGNGPRPDRARALALYRVLQEALLNIHRHAEAASAVITLTFEQASTELVVRDDGRGMVLVEGVPRMGVGIEGMRRRIKQLDGRLRLTSGPKGTTIAARLPLGAAVRAPDAPIQNPIPPTGDTQLAVAERYVRVAEVNVERRRAIVARRIRRGLSVDREQELLELAISLQTQTRAYLDVIQTQRRLGMRDEEGRLVSSGSWPSGLSPELY